MPVNDEETPLLITSISGNTNTTRTNVDAKRGPGIWRKDCLPWLKCRVVITIMTFLGFCNVYALRVNLSMAIVVMVNTTEDSSDTSSGKPVTPIGNKTNHSKVYDWSQSEQGWLLGAFFCGYILTQIPGGWLAHKFGAKHVFGVGIVMTAVLTLFTPAAADISVWALVGVRALEGLFEGVTFPASHALIGAWAPPSERTRIASIAYSGQYVGSVISFPISALLCVYGFNGGWPSVFYTFGCIGILWYVAWLLLAFSSPATHPRISYSERKYIEKGIAEAKAVDIVREHVPTPWIPILTSPAVWAIIVAHFCGNYGFYVLLTTMPTYFAQALGFDLGKDLIMNGVYSAVPYAIQALVVFLVGPLADWLRAKYLSTTTTRKLFGCTSLTTSALFLILTGYLGTSKVVAVTLVSVGVGFGGLSLAGHSINHIDIAPRYSGLLMGITNTAGTIPGIIGPVIAKTIAHSHHVPRSVYIKEWREVFIIAAEVYLFGAAIFAILGDGKKQWWADGDRRKEKAQINLPTHHADKNNNNRKSLTGTIQGPLDTNN